MSGGPAPSSTKKSLKNYNKRLHESKLRIKHLEEFLQDTANECQSLVDLFQVRN